MEWLYAVIGFVVGLLLALLIYLLFIRRAFRRREGEWQDSLTTCQEGNAQLTAQIEACQGAQESLAEAQTEIETLQARVEELENAPVTPEGVNEELDAARKELEKLHRLEKRIKVTAQNLSDARERVKELQAAEVELETTRGELDMANARIASMLDAETVLAERDARIGELERELAISRGEIVVEAVPAEDYTVIEGIGPKINDLLHEAGLMSYAQLSEAEEAQLRAILAQGGSRFGMADPGTWPQQAKLAADGEWTALEALQNILSGGRKG